MRTLIALTAALSAAAARGVEPDPAALSVRPFAIRADFPLADCRRELLELDRLRADLERELNLPTRDAAVELSLFRDTATYREHLARRVGTLVERRALFVKSAGRLAVYVQAGPHLAVDLRHETTHALLHAALGDPPLWLDEGLAEYFEVAADARYDGHANLAAVRDDITAGRAPSLASLERLVDVRDLGAVEYRGAWAWVHFLRHGPVEIRGEFQKYWDDLRLGRGAGSLAARLHDRDREFTRRFVAHFQALAGTQTPPVQQRRGNP